MRVDLLRQDSLQKVQGLEVDHRRSDHLPVLSLHLKIEEHHQLRCSVLLDGIDGLADRKISRVHIGCVKHLLFALYIVVD
jgi:hypothetical protein